MAKQKQQDIYRDELLDAAEAMLEVLGQTTFANHKLGDAEARLSRAVAERKKNLADPAFPFLDDLLHVGAQREQGRLGRYDFVNSEAIYAAAWKKECEHGPILNRILAPPGMEFARVSQRDAKVAATVVTWFGSNVGASFIDMVEKKIKACRAGQRPPERAYSRYVRNNANFPEPTPLQKAKARLDKVRKRVEEVTA